MVCRARLTFRYTEKGPVGLLVGKKAYLVVATGGVPVGSPMDFATPYLRHALSFLGITDVEVVAVKIGMLASADIVRAVAGALALTGAPAVWDPVLLPTAGQVALYQDDPRQARALLDDHLTLLTPNLAEAELLAGVSVTNVAEMKTAAAMLCGAEQAVLIKGGHLAGQPAIDVLAHAGSITEFIGERVATGGPIHGTGCVLSSAIACQLAIGKTIAAAASAGKEYVAARLRRPVVPGRGMGFLL